MEDMIDCECGSKQFGYTDTVNVIYVCYKCGRYKGNQVDKEFSEMLKDDPLILLGMIKEKYLTPIK
jgi:hypothetical protein